MHRYRSLFTAPQLRVEAPKKPLTRRVGKVLWKALKRTCMTVGAAVLLWSVIATLFMASLESKKSVVPLPNEMVLYYRMNNPIYEQSAKPSFADPFPERSLTMAQLVRTFDAVERDDRVKGIVVSLHGQSLGLSQIQEFRRSIKELQEAGKFAYVIAADYGVGGGLGSYYFASVFDRIWMHPVGVVSMTGMSMETPYVKSVLDKLGVTPQFFQRKEFKSAFESFTADKMSGSNREAMQAMLDDIGGQVTMGIAQGRGFDENAVQGFMKDALIPAPQALEEQLVDALGYGVDVVDYIKKTHGMKDVSIVELPKYAGRIMGKKRGKEDVAYIYIGGQLSLAASPYSQEYEDRALLFAGSDIAAAIMDAADQPDIRAIVLRVDSPGGTPASAEVIRHAVLKAKEKGKKVYVSMASMAASGGYWLSADADQIFALPGTLTGSIGVVGGKVTFQELAKKLDINIEKIRYGENAGFWSVTTPFNDSQIKRFEGMLDVTYQNFITLVAEGRGMSVEEAEARAKGRVWTGAQALERDLVDGFGGLGVTLDVLAKDLGHETQSDLSLVQFPRPKARYQEVLEFLENQAAFMGVMAKLAPMFESLSVYLETPEAGVNVHSGLSGV